MGTKPQALPSRPLQRELGTQVLTPGNTHAGPGLQREDQNQIHRNCKISASEMGCQEASQTMKRLLSGKFSPLSPPTASLRHSRGRADDIIFLNEETESQGN